MSCSLYRSEIRESVAAVVLRATFISTLFNCAFDAPIIGQQTGHQCLKGVNLYKTSAKKFWLTGTNKFVSVKFRIASLCRTSKGSKPSGKKWFATLGVEKWLFTKIISRTIGHLSELKVQTAKLLSSGPVSYWSYEPPNAALSFNHSCSKKIHFNFYQCVQNVAQKESVNYR